MVAERRSGRGSSAAKGVAVDTADGARTGDAVKADKAVDRRRRRVQGCLMAVSFLVRFADCL